MKFEILFQKNANGQSLEAFYPQIALIFAGFFSERRRLL